MDCTLQVRRGTTQEWSNSSYILKSGEPGLDTDLNILKFGDGSSTWASLSPINGSTGGGIHI